MSQHKKQAKPDIYNQLGSMSRNDTIYQALNDPQTHIKQLLKAIYRDGATGTSRSLSKDVQTITDLVHKEQQ